VVDAAALGLQVGDTLIKPAHFPAAFDLASA
jgi:hypothetical protein